MPFLLGLVSKDKYRETTVSDFEVARAEDLWNEELKPVTGFEIHFLRVMRGDSLPCTPKEIALVEAVTANGLASRDYGDDYYDLQEREPEQDYDEKIAQWHSSLGGGSLDRRDERLTAAENDAYRSSLISSYQDWLETDRSDPFEP